MCEIAEYLRTRQELVRGVTSHHERVMRAHKEAIRIFDLEDLAYTLIGHSAFLKKFDLRIREAALRGEMGDLQDAEQEWERLAMAILGHLRRSQTALNLASERGYEVSKLLTAVAEEIDFIDRALVSADETIEAAMDLAKDALQRDEHGLTREMPDPDDW